MKGYIERMEIAAENRFIEATKDCLPGCFKCGCGRIEHIDNAQPNPLDPSPYAEMICNNCFMEAMEKI